MGIYCTTRAAANIWLARGNPANGCSWVSRRSFLLVGHQHPRTLRPLSKSHSLSSFHRTVTLNLFASLCLSDEWARPPFVTVSSPCFVTATSKAPAALQIFPQVKTAPQINVMFHLPPPLHLHLPHQSSSLACGHQTSLHWSLTSVFLGYHCPVVNQPLAALVLMEILKVVLCKKHILQLVLDCPGALVD